MEVWKDIEGWQGYYQVSTYGNVRSLDRLCTNGNVYKGRLLKPGKTPFGYNQFVLSKGGKLHLYLGHRLVAQAFVSNPNNYPIINHIDSNPANNLPKNLEWCTQAHNMLHGQMSGNGYKKTGSNNYKSKLTEQAVLTILKEVETVPVKTLAKQYGVNVQTIYKIFYGGAWNQVTGLPRKRYYKLKTAA